MVGQQRTSQSEQSDALLPEEEIRVLEERLTRLRKLAEESAPASRERGKMPEGVGARETPTAPPPPPQPIQPPSAQTGDDHLHTVKLKELKTYETDKQLTALVELAFEQGLRPTIEIAKRLDEPYLLDALHDALVDELRKQLIEHGRLQEV